MCGYSSAGGRGNAWALLERRAQTPKNFQNMNIFIFGTLFSDIFVIILPGYPALLIPKATETPSRGPLTPLYGGKGNELRG